MSDDKKLKSTNWIVFTGAPSSGKTTILELLEKKEHDVVYEAAREYLNEGKKKGFTTEEMRKSEADFQDEVLKRKIEIENNLNSNKVKLLDRALLDSIAYYEHIGVTNKTIENISVHHKYAKVLFFERLPLMKDGKRTESENDANEISRILLSTYKKFGYHPISIPRFHANKEKSIKSRLEYIENFL